MKVIISIIKNKRILLSKNYKGFSSFSAFYYSFKIAFKENTLVGKIY